FGPNPLKQRGWSSFICVFCGRPVDVGRAGTSATYWTAMARPVRSSGLSPCFSAQRVEREVAPSCTAKFTGFADAVIDLAREESCSQTAGCHDKQHVRVRLCARACLR